MRLYIFYFALIFFTICSCKETTQSSKQNTEETQNDSFKDEHTSQNSLDWSGVYKGTLPCADCAGIETEIELHPDLSYQKTVRYLGKSNESMVSEGKFKWEDSGKSIQFLNQDPPNTYKVFENAIVALDMNGQQIEGDLKSFYRLEKTNSEE